MMKQISVPSAETFSDILSLSVKNFQSRYYSKTLFPAKCSCLIDSVTFDFRSGNHLSTLKWIMFNFFLDILLSNQRSDYRNFSSISPSSFLLLPLTIKQSLIEDVRWYRYAYRCEWGLFYTLMFTWQSEWLSWSFSFSLYLISLRSGSVRRHPER